MNFEIINPLGTYPVLKAKMHPGKEFFSMPGKAMGPEGVITRGLLSGGRL